MPARVRILVCGEPLRGDDGIALLAVRGLDAATLERAEVVEVGQLDPDHLAMEPPLPLLVIDAVAGGRPGHLWDMPLDELAGLGRRAAAVRSTHVLPPHEIVALAVALTGQTPSGRFLGASVERTTFGADLSPAARRALPHLTARVAAWVERLGAPAVRDVPSGPPAGDVRHFSRPAAAGSVDA